jgi:hypothetical protein
MGFRLPSFLWSDGRTVPFSVLRGRCLADSSKLRDLLEPASCMRFCTVRGKEMNVIEIHGEVLSRFEPLRPLP